MRRPERRPRGIPLRAVVPNAVTALALCFGLTGVRFAIEGKWELAVLAIVVAAVLDGMDGRIARMLNGQSRFGAELDSLSDVIAFGVSPAVIIYLWSLQENPRYLWLWTDQDIFREPWVVAPWAALVAFLMVSNVATFSWTSLRLRSHVRLWAIVVIALLGAALFSAPWPALSLSAMLYAALIPASLYAYGRVKKQRAGAARAAAPSDEPSA